MRCQRGYDLRTTGASRRSRSHPNVIGGGSAGARGRSATQSGMPMDSKPLPATNSPGRVEIRRASAAVRPAWPTRCCAPALLAAEDARQHRRRGDAEDRSEVADRHVDRRPVVEIDRAGIVGAAGKGAQQHVIRRGAMVPLRRDPGARRDADVVVPARHDESAARQRMRRRRDASSRAPRWPSRRRAPRSQSRAASTSRGRSSAAAACAGAARMTADGVDPIGAGGNRPSRSAALDPGDRGSSCARRRREASSRSRRRDPPSRRAARGTCPSRRVALHRGCARCRRAAAPPRTSRGNTERIDSRSMSPAWMPPSSGSAMRSTVAAPNRRLKNAATDSSSAAGSRNRAARARRASRAGQSSRSYREQRRECGRDAEHRRRRQGMEAAVAQDEGGARRPRRHELRRRGRAPRRARVAAGFCASSESGPASIVNPSRALGADQSAEARRGLRAAGTRRCARASSNAAARPVMPPPTTTIMHGAPNSS